MKRFWIGFFILCFVNPVAGQELCADPTNGIHFGVVEHRTWAFLYSPEQIEQALEMMSAAGIGWVRLNWSWKDFAFVVGRNAKNSGCENMRARRRRGSSH